ncbi:MAG: cellobiose phosphorylase, partial [Candidatus Omnitrophota bacterium]
VNNFGGVKIDGSNATIIGKNPGDFIADRNNISRVWMDHGVWPMITLKLYIDETGDFDILFEQAAYFRNHQLNRSKIIDYKWDDSYGTRLKARNGKIYKGTVLEHLLIQNLVQFYNVGSHNQVRLEGADWNDGLDMAKENGESVAFSSMYAANLSVLAKLILETGRPSFELAEEIRILLAHFNYSDIGEKHRILEFYFSKAGQEVSGKKVRVDAAALSGFLKEKSIWMKKQIEKREWLKEGFFNGYYDNRKNRVEGRFGGVLRMSLASQVFPVMSGLAGPWQVKKIISNVLRYLYDKSSGGIRLNTDFKKEMHDLGRAFSFSYGDKENGSVFSHMVVMFANGLYQQNFAKEGWMALSSLYRMAANTDNSKVYPCLPEYFDISGRGMYSYLTGSASWFMLTLLTQAFGVKGQNGDLLIEPKLVSEQFKPENSLSISRTFSGRKLKVTYINPKGLEFGRYRIKSLKINSENFSIEPAPRLLISKEAIFSLPKDKLNLIEVLLD